MPDKDNRIIVCLDYADEKFNLIPDFCPTAIVDENGVVKEIYGGYDIWHQEDKEAFETFYKAHFHGKNQNYLYLIIIGIFVVLCLVTILLYKKLKKKVQA